MIHSAHGVRAAVYLYRDGASSGLAGQKWSADVPAYELRWRSHLCGSAVASVSLLSWPSVIVTTPLPLDKLTAPEVGDK